MAAKDTAIYLPECLDSILAQTYTNWELIAVSDHSTDNTLEVLKKYAAQDARIRVFESPNPKLIPTLKHGYQYAKGDLINRMDSDDKMPYDKLEALVKKWEQYGKGYVIAGGTQHFVEEGEVGAGFRRYDDWLNGIAKNSLHYQEIYKECVIPSHCWIIHKEDFDRVDGFNPVVYPEDYDLTFRFYQDGLKIIGIDKILHYWRDRSNRISRTWDEYKDNRYFDLKIKYFLKLDRDNDRPLVLWGGGKNGKDMAKILQQNHQNFHWVCDSPSKIGKDIYGVTMQYFEDIPEIRNPQIMIVVSSPKAKIDIQDQLLAWDKQPVLDYWYFL